MESDDLISLTAAIVFAHVSNNTVAVGDVAMLVQNVHNALAGLGTAGLEAPDEEPAEQKAPVVSVRSSVKADHIICLECGRKSKTLKRHLMAAHGMTPDEYRSAYGLPFTYPMVTKEYSQRRQQIAKTMGLGGNPVLKKGSKSASPKQTSARKPRKKAESEQKPGPQRRKTQKPAAIS